MKECTLQARLARRKANDEWEVASLPTLTKREQARYHAAMRFLIYRDNEGASRAQAEHLVRKEFPEAFAE